jgi:hypothetical protein
MSVLMNNIRYGDRRRFTARLKSTYLNKPNAQDVIEEWYPKGIGWQPSPPNAQVTRSAEYFADINIILNNVRNVVPTASVAATFSPTNSYATEMQNFSGAVLLPSGKVYLVPMQSPRAVIYDPIKNTQTYSPVHGAVDDTAYPCAFLGGVLLNDGRVFNIPYQAKWPVIYDPIANTFFACATHTQNLSGAFAGGVLLPDGRVFMSPSAASAPKIYNVATNGYTSCSAYKGTQGAVLLPDGRVYCVPAAATTGAVYTGTSKVLTPAHTVGSMCSGVLLPDGRVYVGSHNGTNCFIYDPVANTNTLCPTYSSYTTGTDSPFSGACLLPDGNVFNVPWHHNRAMVYNPKTNTNAYYTNSNLPTQAVTNGICEGVVLLPDGRVCGAGYSTTYSAVLFSYKKVGLPMDMLTSPYYNKF